MMLIPARMKKVVVVGLKEDRDTVLSVLHDLRMIQVEPVSPDVLDYFSLEKGGAMEKSLGDQVLRFKTLVAALPPVKVEAREHFPSTEALLEAAYRIKVDPEVHELKKREDELLTLSENLKETQTILSQFSFFEEDLSLLVAKSIFSFFATVPEDHYEAFRGGTRSLSRDAYLSDPVPAEDGRKVRCVVVVPRESAEAFAKLTQKHGARLFAVPTDFEGRPSAALGEVEERLAVISKELEGIRDHLLTLSKEWYPKVLPIEEELVIESRKTEVLGKLGQSSSSFSIEGWITERDIPRMQAEVRKVTKDWCHIIVTEEKEGAPTLLRNPKGFSVFEFFIKFYSLPQSSEIDPTLIFAIVFPIFFGFMLGDAGYAAFILSVCLWMIWRIGNPKAGPTIVPRFLVKFTTTVVPPPAMKKLAKTLIAGCLFGLVLGVAFDSYFGFTLGQFTLGHFDFVLIAGKNGYPGQLTYVAKLLLMSVYIGLAMVTLGEVFGAINSYFHRKWKHLAGKVSWILVAWGVTLAGLSLIHHYQGSWLIAYNQFLNEYVAVAIVGVAGVLATEGALSMVEVPSIMSHVLSYARLIGILLASVILAYVINSIAIIGISSQPALITHGMIYAILAIVLVVVVAVFNIILGVLEPGIQGARLLYVEYFSKFYTGNGKPFNPFGSQRKYTRPQLLESHPELKA